jgi:hypothetical protein
MLRPGEVRNDCGGCHAHNQLPVDFAGTAAAQASYQVADLTTQTPLLTKDAAGNTTVKQAGHLMVDVEYYKDIKPILQRSCVQCHSKSGAAAAGLVLDDTTLVNGYDNTYNRLANDSSAQWGIPPVVSNRQWRQTNASRYVRMFQSRRSLLAWKVFGQRLDGWTNAAHPTESTPGNPSTLPSGANPDEADVDYTGAIMPPPNSGFPPLTDDQKMTIARWIDLGAPITAQGDPTYKGYFADEIKPTLTVSSPRSGLNAGPLSVIRIGMFDAYSGIDRSSLSVTTNFAVNGNPAGAELAAGFSETDQSVWTLPLTTPVTSTTNGHIVVRVKDNSGNYTTIDRWFSIGASGPPPPPPQVTVTPSSVTLSGSGTQQFTATSGPVQWSISPNAGSISTSGLYKAPTSITVQQAVTVTATSTSDSTNFATATITLKPTAPPPPPPNAIAIDTSVWRDQSTASSALTSPTFSTKHGSELLLVFIAADYLSGANTTVKAVTGAGLKWVRVARTNAQSGDTEIWRAFASTPVHNSAVKATLSQAVVSSMTILSFTGVDPLNPVGLAASGNSQAGAPQATLVTTRNNSWVFGVSNDYDNAIARTPAPGQSIVHQYLTPTSDTYWVQMLNAQTPVAGTAVTMSDTAPATDRYNFTLVEILPAR